MTTWVYLLLFLAPFSGGLIALYTGYKNESLLKIFLSFAGGYIFSITILDLFPIIFSEPGSYAPWVVLAGFFFQIVISRFSEGAEHGHLHTHHHDHNLAVPLGLFISMCLHAFTEGLPLGIVAGTSNVMGFGIALHELPAAFALISILQTEHLKKSTVLALMVLYAAMSPMGAFTSSMLRLNLPESMFSPLLAFVAGIFLYISTTILFENSPNHHFSRMKTAAVGAGVLLAVLAQLLV